MKNILSKLLDKWLCKHDWELFKHTKVYDEFSNGIPCAHKYIFICKKCGKIKKVKT